MNLDLGSFAFGSSIQTGGGTPSWGTSLGQSKPDYKFTYPGAEAIVVGMTYCAVPSEAVSLPLGKGGRIYQASELRECVLASLFHKVYINGKRINHPFVMVLIKESSDSHSGRRSIKYSDKNAYASDSESYSNADFVRIAQQTLGLTENSCWFVYKFEIYNQDELHMSAVIVDEEEPVEYENSSERKTEWLALIPDADKEYVHASSPALPPLDQPHQQIFYGAPGTGKSHTIKVATEACPKENVVRTTFHPDSDYSTFVGAYKPAMKSGDKILSYSELIDKLSTIKTKGHTYPCQKFAAKYWHSLKLLSTSDTKDIISACGFPESMLTEISKGIAIGEDLASKNLDVKIVYEFVPQAFLKAYVKAWQVPEEPVFLIIEEINRGNCAQIFGDLFQLLDREEGISEYPIKADQDMQQYLTEALSGCEGLDEKIRSGEELQLPSNLYIWATMNTSDQSLFPIDSAFKRRWEWRYMPIAQGRDEKTGKPLQWRIVAEKSEYDWWSFLQKINEQIASTTSSEDKKLGFFFTKAKEGVISAEKFVSKVIFYLWNDVFKDYGFDNKIFQILDEENATLTFDKFYTIDNTGNTIVRKDLVERFLDGLGVEKAGTIDNGQLTMDNEEVYDESADATTPGQERKDTLSSVSINGKLFTEQEYTQFDLYMNVLREIGIDKAGAAIEAMKFVRKGSKMATKNPLPQLSGEYTYVKEGDYYYIKGANPYTLIRILEELKKSLQLDMEIVYR